MRDETKRQTIAEALVSARKKNESFLSYPGELPTTMDEAYAIQDIALALDGRKVGGWKLGKIAPEMAEQYQAERLVGPIFVDEIFDGLETPDPVMPVFGDGFAAVEAELLLKFGETPQREYERDEVDQCIDEVRIGIEVASSPFLGINQNGPAATASDFGNNKGVVLGTKIENWRNMDLMSMPVETIIDDKIVGSGTMQSMLDGPFGSVAFLIKALNKRNIEILPGTWVSAGAITGVHPVKPGQSVAARFQDAMSVTCRMAGL